MEPGQLTQLRYSLVAPLQGLFGTYSVGFEAIDSFGNTQAVVSSAYETHTLVHMVQITAGPHADRLNLLVNDVVAATGPGAPLPAQIAAYSSDSYFNALNAARLTAT